MNKQIEQAYKKLKSTLEPTHKAQGEFQALWKLVKAELEPGTIRPADLATLVEAEKDTLAALIEIVGQEEAFHFLRHRCRTKYKRLPTNKAGRAAIGKIAKSLQPPPQAPSSLVLGDDSYEDEDGYVNILL